MGKNIVLIGFMGTGKSTVGSKLAEKLGMNFVDMDREIENLTGLTINDLFRRHGEIRFRSEEGLMVKKLGQQANLVIASGGGVVLKSENVQTLRKNGILILLEANPEDIYKRVSRKKGTRPLLKKNLVVKDIADMLQQREPYYACADFRVNTSDRELNEIVREIVGIVHPLRNKNC
ncbi:MAG: shikimate kinase [Syntrophomonadaceae bacterium]|nr:shikimate kinase [Syntrophomonadaceae bacterium]